MTEARLEVTLKFNSLPQARQFNGKWQFTLTTGTGQMVTVEVAPKAWNKLVKAAEDWPDRWVASVTGGMGRLTSRGFDVVNPGLQVFEKKPKTQSEAA